MPAGELFFALSGLALALIPWALSRLGVKVPRLIVIGGLIVGLGSLAGAVAIPAYEWLFTPATYAYLLPGRGLGQNSAPAPREFVLRRVFVLEQVGPKILHNVKVILRDNHAKDQAQAHHIENYPQVDPRESGLKNVQPKHFWFKPSTPWDEDYTVTISSGEKLFLERILVRGFVPPPGTPINPPPPPEVKAQTGDAPLSPEMGKVEFAIRVTTSGSDTALFTCQDQDLIGQPDWRNDPVQPCLQHGTGIQGFEAGLDPRPFVLTLPGGMIDMTPSLPPIVSSRPETEADTRRLSEWQKAQLQSTLERYPDHNVLILFVGDPNTRRYAQDFVDVFQASKWKAKGPIQLAVTSTQSPITDVQVSTWKSDFGHERQIALDIGNAFKNTGIKGGDRLVCNLDRSDVLVVLVGVKSPEENPSYHPPYSLPEIDQQLANF